MRLRALLVGGAGTLLLTLACYDFDASREACEAPGGACAPLVSPDPDCVPSGPDVPDDDFVDSDCDGIDGVVGAGLFVDPLAGDDSAAGTPEAPMRTLAAALQRAQGAGKTLLYLGAGAFNEGELTLAQPIALHGGYAGREGRWARGSTFTSHLDGGVTALTVRDVSASVLIDHVLLTSLTPTAPGSPSIAMRVLRAAEVQVNGSVLAAGAGSAGAAGTAGGAQPAGTNGADGGVGSPPPGSGLAGSGAQATCGTEDVQGGAGGTGGDRATASGAGAQGRRAGTPVTPGGDAGSSFTVVSSEDTFCSGLIIRTCTCVGGAGGGGASGAAGSAGASADGGTGRGLLVGDTWQAERASSGSPGGAGAGGGGGGGGGFCSPPSSITTGGGGGGGQGGAGGCGGLGGTGGQGGGASIAVLVVDSGLTISNSTLRTAGGGAGGAGGAGADGGVGGPGGPGGPGGAGGQQEGNPSYNLTGGAGGRGGDGGVGGAGGAGGGGAGGPSVGVWCNKALRVKSTGRFTQVLGQGGAGGGGPGNAGDAGVVLDVVNCVP